VTPCLNRLERREGMRMLCETFVNTSQQLLFFRLHLVHCPEFLNETGMRLFFGK
jgi:hypothetical protein